ncbi:MAG: AAA family ATPase [Planctomycetota bacterium]
MAGTAVAPLARDPSSEAPGASPVPTGWRLWSVVCQSIRGVAPAGELLTFPFDGRSTLIFGPNGSGKSSLLGAVAWVLTGRVILDTEEDADSTPIYRIPSGTGRGSKICDWPVVVTLPVGGDPSSASATCMAQLELRSEDGRTLWIRRTLPNRVETRTDRHAWTAQADLAGWGIQPLDLQLSLLAPTVFGRLTIEQAPDTRSLLSLMLGYDDLESLGELAGKLGANRTRLANTEATEHATAKRALREELSALSGMLAHGSPRRKELEALLLFTCPSAGEIAEIEKRVAEDVRAAEASLAELLGLAGSDNAPPSGLANRLTSTIASFEKGVGHNFPLLRALALESVLAGTDGKQPAERLAEITRSFQQFTQRAQRRIVRRLDWARKEAAAGRKLALRLRAAQDYDPEQGECPVCDRSVEGLPIQQELATLKGLDPELQREVSDFFRDLRSELDAIVVPRLAVLGELTPRERIVQDWSTLRDATGATLAPITGRFEERVRLIADGIALVEPEAIRLVPDDADADFAKLAQRFVEQTAKAQKALGVLAWSVRNLSGVQAAIDGVVTTSSPQEGESLLTALSKGKQAAEDIKPLTSVRDHLRILYKDRGTLETKAEELTLLEELRSPLDQLKLLSKYAADEVAQVFGSIRDKTIENWKKLYPERSSGLAPARLHMGTGRDKTVESLLAGGRCEVPGRFFANAGLQRAIALSFFFALLDRHPRGLVFVVLDDPILSLDEDHRESWSANVLKPWVDDLQVILATHQRQYLNHRRHDFDSGRVVELNPRSRAGRMTWRPGDRLERAAEELERAPTNAPPELRKYREELLITLDAYSPQPFFDPDDLAQSLQRYRQFSSPHPLASSAQRRLAEKLAKPEVTQVLDPGSHAPTEADVTAPVIQQCLDVLRTCDTTFHEELKRLERLRTHELRRASIPASATPFRGALPGASWTRPITLRLLGRAAARPDSLTIIAEEETSLSALLPGCAVLVAADTLDPVARPGQWVLLAEEDSPVADGDLAAISTDNAGRLLRRIWSEGEEWVLQAVNPVRPIPSVTLRKLDTAVRKIVGVLYEPLRQPRPPQAGAPDEWQPRADFDPSALGRLRTIVVEGHSLDPIARRGQKVLVGERELPGSLTMTRGGLAVIEILDEAVGTVIKRVFPGRDRWVLVSPNPTEPHEPIVLPAAQIRAVWPLRGVLFESRDGQNG